MHHRNRTHEQGVSLPFVLGALLLFSALAIALSGVANLTIRHNAIAQQRTKAHFAVEAGANDFVNRLNAYSEFDQWNADRVKQALDQRTPVSVTFPKIVRESGFAQWVRIPGTPEQFTYDIISRDGDAIIIRVTGRFDHSSALVRSAEFRVARRAKGDTAIAVQRPYVNAAGYAYVQQVRDQGYALGNMAGRGGTSYLSTSEYDVTCGDYAQVPAEQRWERCFRPAWTYFDQVDGDLVTGFPFTVHGVKGYLDPSAGMAGWPQVRGTVEIVGGQRHQPAASTRMGSGTQAAGPQRYSEQETRAALGSSRVFLGDYTALTSPPAQFKEIRRTASPDKTCRFIGATQVVMYADDIYVRSPHTPAALNNGWASWCDRVRDQFYGRTRTQATPDLPFASAGNAVYLLPKVADGWVKLENVPAGAVFLIERIPGVASCAQQVLSDNDGVGNATGVGFPANRDYADPLLDTSVDPYGCANGDLYIDGVVSRSRTFAVEGNAYLTGGIRYSDRANSTNAIPQNSDDLFGLVAQRNVFIYNPPSRDCTSCQSAFYRYPRSPYPLPIHERELGRGVGGQPMADPMPWTVGELQAFRAVPSSLGPDDRYVIRGKIPSKVGWYTLPQFDGVYVAETGAFMLENPLMHNRPTRLGNGRQTGALSAVVTGAVYSRYAPLLHIDYEATPGDVTMVGLHGHFISDRRLATAMPPGFNGLSVTMYRIAGIAELGRDHLTASYQYTP